MKSLQLKPSEQRLLRWLYRYPLQRVADLVVALAPWMKRGAVYTLIQDLQARQLIEAVHYGAKPGKGGKCFYHLSPSGLRLCESLDGSTALPQARERFLQLLPRLRTLCLIQDLVMSLVLGAPRAMAEIGRQPDQMRWNWIREYRHAFVPRGRDQAPLLLRAEAALTFGIRGEGGLWHWSTALLWYYPFEDRRVLRLRLNRLLRWRESQERQHQYQAMPAVFILATTARQAQLWQLAATQEAARLHVALPVGAICLEQDGPGWLRNWRVLGSDESCHVQSLLLPCVTQPLPELREGSWEQQPLRTLEQVLPRQGKHLFALDRYLVQQIQQRDDYRLASAYLTPRHWQMLFFCFAHPVVARDHLAALLGLHPDSVQKMLAEVRIWGYLTEVATPLGSRWHLSDAGLRLIAHAGMCSVRRLSRNRPDAPLQLQQKGVTGFLSQLAHTTELYHFFADLHSSLQQGGGALAWWETGVFCERFFHYRGKTYRFKPDGEASIQLGPRHWQFWLEWDRGTMGVRDLEVKCATSAAYVLSREWATRTVVLPALVWIAPEIAQERRLIRCARALLAHVPGAHLYTTTAALLGTQGIFAPIWQRVQFQSSGLKEAQGRGPLFGMGDPL